MTEANSSFGGWCILELMGHRKYGGHVSETEIAGAQFLRLDVHNNSGQILTQYYSPSSVYCITPTSENIARRMGEAYIPAPVGRFDLPPAENEIPQQDTLFGEGAVEDYDEVG